MSDTSLMYRYGINTYIFHLTFSRTECQSYRIKCLITGISNAATNE